MLYDYVFQRVKDNQFEDVQWSDTPVDELKIHEDLALSDDQKRQWLMLVVNYCRQIWGHFSFVGGNIKHNEGMKILSNFIDHKSSIPTCLKNKLMKRILHTLHKDDSKDHISIHIARKRAKELKAEGKTDSKFEWTVFSKVSDALKKANFKGMH